MRASAVIVFSLSILIFPTITRADLLTNGDFSAGNTGFTSQYVFDATTGSVEGHYTVGNNPINYHPTFSSSFGDHTTGTGLMLIANGAITSNVAVWQETVPVNPSTNYTFSGFVASWGNSGSGSDPSPAILGLFVNNVQTGGNADAPAVNGQWQSFSINWNSGANTTATLALVDSVLVSGGNDYAVDDLSFNAVPEPTSLALAATALPLLLRRRRKTLPRLFH